MNGPLAGRRVLMIEDEFLVAAMLSDVIEDSGATVVGIAGTLDDALLQIDRAAPELVVLDWNLDGRRSDPIARELIARGVPFAISTGYGEVDSEFGGVPVIAKPYEPMQLVAVLNRLCESSSSA